MGNTTKPTLEKAVLVGVVTGHDTRAVVEDSLNELALLADTAGAVVLDRVVQALPKLHPATYIGAGKVEEIKALVALHKIDLVIFDDDLSPVQIRNLEKKFKCKLVDRSALILDIFAGRAKTAIAKTQVELAQLEYLRTRLTRAWTHLSRQKGGIGFKGPGETQIETDRRLIGTRIATLKQRLKKIDKQKQTQRKRRSSFTRVSLVGYTNAGKSTLMNQWADAGVHAEDRLFATLDPTTRLVELTGNQSILLSDTVGFIRKLPHRLIESFKSTLDEVRESDILLHVVDATHPQYEEHIQVVNATLRELDALDKPMVMVFNKVDGLEDHAILNAFRNSYEHTAFVSALRGIGMDGLKEAVVKLMAMRYEEHTVLVPVTASKAIAQIHEMAEVLAEDYGYAVNGDPEAQPQAVARVSFRVGPQEKRDLLQLLAPFEGYNRYDSSAG